MADFSFFFKGPFHHRLGGNPGVVRSGQPQNLPTQESGASGKNVLNRIIENMPKGQNSCDVGRGNDNGVTGLFGVRISAVIAPFDPLVIKPVFDLGWFVGWSELRHGAEQNALLGGA